MIDCKIINNFWLYTGEFERQLLDNYIYNWWQNHQLSATVGHQHKHSVAHSATLPVFYRSGTCSALALGALPASQTCRLPSSAMRGSSTRGEQVIRSYSLGLISTASQHSTWQFLITTKNPNFCRFYPLELAIFHCKARFPEGLNHWRGQTLSLSASVARITSTCPWLNKLRITHAHEDGMRCWSMLTVQC